MKGIKRNTIGVIFAISTAMLSFDLIIGKYSIIKIIVTILASLGCSIYFYNKTVDDFFSKVKQHKIFSAICVILAFIIFMQLYLVKVRINKYKWSGGAINPFRFRFAIISIISLIYFSIFLGLKIKEWLINLYKSLDSWEKKAYLMCSIIGFIIVLIAYNFSDKYYLQYDNVYSLDSGWCFSSILPKANYYDIRHPILGVFTFPIFAIVDFMVKGLVDGKLTMPIEAIIFQYINVQLLILTGMMLKKMTKNKIIFIMYMLSFPTILYSVFFEKYQLCVFLIVAYIFSMNNNDNNNKSMLISAAGCMPTSCTIGILEFFSTEKIQKKLLNIGKIILTTALIFICLGRGHIFKSGLKEMSESKKSFSSKTTIEERGISTTKMIQSCFVALPSSAQGEKYLWDDLTKTYSILAIIMCAIIILGGIIARKTIAGKAFIIWTLFAPILFIVLNWSPHESPLFSLYFSWAVIPLFVMGLDYIIKKIKINPKIVYGIVFTLIVIINITTIFDINSFLTTI